MQDGKRRTTTRRFLTLGAMALGLLVSGQRAYAQIGGAAKDPTKVMGAEACGECHTTELNAWRETHHAKTFREMHRRDEATAIVKALGGGRIKRNEHCIQCHYTEGLRNGKPRALWGITCESCHSQAKDWMELHSDFGGKDVSRETESTEHREQRLSKTAAAGMIRPAMTYEAASNCYQCHTVPDEELVNVGGHKPRSDFELVAWSQGEVRHNYYYSDDKKNRPATTTHRRVLYVTGRALDLEYSLRAAARATGPGPYLETNKKAVSSAVEKLREIQSLHATPELEQMLNAAAAVTIEANQASGLETAADAVSKAAQAFVANHDGEKLGALEALLPDPSSYHGTARP